MSQRIKTDEIEDQQRIRIDEIESEDHRIRIDENSDRAGWLRRREKEQRRKEGEGEGGEQEGGAIG